MKNYRFYLSNSQITDDFIIVEDEALLHKMNNVLRLSKGSTESLEFFDDKGQVFQAQIKEISKTKASFEIKDRLKSSRELSSFVKFYIPVIKPENYYWMIKKLTELGVSEFQPVFFRRSQKKYKESLNKQKDKILTILKEATEQCGAAKLPNYADIVDFEELDFTKDALKYPDISRFFAYEDLSLDKNSKKAKDLPQLTDTVIMVGPEGGLTADETGKLGENSFIALSLGKRILKAETAAIVLFASMGLGFCD